MNEEITVDNINIAKTWYAEQRGRVNGNTRAWEDLTSDEQYNIIYAVADTLGYMKEAWQWPAG